MTERTTAFQSAAYGVESTPGSSATISTRLVGLSIKPQVKVETHKYTPQGSLWPTIMPLGKDYTEAKLDGEPVYEELGFLFGSALCAGSGGTYNPNSSGPNTPSTYTVQVGSTGRAEKFSYGVVTGFGLKWTRSSIDISGDMIGSKLTTSTTFTTGSAPATITPMTPNDVTVTYAGSGLTRCFEVDLNVSGRWKPVWVIDSSQNSFVAIAEAVPEGTIKIKTEADAQGFTFLDNLRANNTTETLIISCVNGSKSCTITAAVKVSDVESFEDEDGVYAVGYTLAIVYDSSLSYSIKAEVA